MVLLRRRENDGGPSIPTDDETSRLKPHLRLLSRREVMERVPWSYPKIWDAMRHGEFPRSRQSAAGSPG